MIRNPELPLQGYFSAAGSRWRIRSNCAGVLQAAGETFPRLSHGGSIGLAVDVYVDPADNVQRLWKVPQFRGRDHLVFADYGPNNGMLADLGARHVIGRFSAAAANHESYWRQIIFPILLGVAGAVVGVTALHCACLQYQGEGLLITGESGAGKSTLAFELARRGLEFISDDWTYLSPVGAQVFAWGLPTKIKLLPDSVLHFPELRGRALVKHINGELAFEVDPEEAGAKRSINCLPRRIFLLDRRPGFGFEISPMAANEISAYFEQSLERLPACLAGSRAAQLATIHALSQGECWHLRCGGTPQEIAARILEVCEYVPPRPARVASPVPVTRREWPDMLRRFVALPFAEQFSFEGCPLRVATDSEDVMRTLRQILDPAVPSCEPPLSWTIQEEPDWILTSMRPNALACGALSFLSLGRHSFVACDHRTRRAVAFIGTRDRRKLERGLRAMLAHLREGKKDSTLQIPPHFAMGVKSDISTS